MRKQLIFIGAPGSGKGTQANKLVAGKNYKHISTGDLLRAEIAKKSPLGLEVKAVMDEGKLVSDELVIKLILANTDLDKDVYIFDGYPRNLIQAQTLENNVLKGKPFLAVYFQIDEVKLVSRLTNRRTCKKCGAIYNLLTQKPTVEGVCDSCGAQDMAHRDDDKEEVIRKRMEVFQQSIGPVLDFYRAKGCLETVQAESDIGSIYQQITSKL